MKKLSAVALLGLAVSGLSTQKASALWPFSNHAPCCTTMSIHCRQYNAFSPFCCDSACYAGQGGPVGCLPFAGGPAWGGWVGPAGQMAHPEGGGSGSGPAPAPPPRFTPPMPAPKTMSANPVPTAPNPVLNPYANGQPWGPTPYYIGFVPQYGMGYAPQYPQMGPGTAPQYAPTMIPQNGGASPWGYWGNGMPTGR